MKKAYTNPEMNISVFMNENVVTAVSGTITAAEYAEQNATSIFQQAAGGKTVKAVLVF